MQTTMATERSQQQDTTNQTDEAKPARRKPGPKPGTEAARRGGTAARDKYGREFYSRIGAKGGSTVRERHGSLFYTEIGRRGGQSTKRNLGVEHYSRIGRIGGQRAHGRKDTNADVDTNHTDLGGSRAAE
jgi:general stress protein YciG